MMLLRFCLAFVSISIHLTLSVSSSETERLWRLTNEAVQITPLPNFWKSRQNRPPRTAIPYSFIAALESIASNDALRCVPRLLCELTSGQKQTGKDLALPLNINAESLFGLISASVNSPSPIVTFARAALLGYTSRGDTASCYQAYPTCPKDPDKLMQYLNNYNGGFFRLFSGIPAKASKRILNNYQTGDRFTFHAGLRSPKIFTFPNEKDVTFQRPPVGHVKVSMVFPDRTGTGELKLDVSELGTSGNELYANYNKMKLNKVFRFPAEDF